LTVTPKNTAAVREETRLGTGAHARLAQHLHYRPRSEHALLALVAASVVAHVIVSFSRSTAVFFPDEYLFSELSRSLSSSGLPLVRGALIGFPSLLQPIVTAPFWLLDSVEAGFRASMVLDSIVMSLAAVPVYWLGRRLGLSGWLALAPSALALATPSMLYSSWLMGEALAYPLFLTGFSMGVLALSGEKRWGVPALVFFALASLARIQLLVLPLAFAFAALLMAARERRLRRFLGEHRYLVGAGVLLAVVVAIVPEGAFGFYSGIRHIDLAPGRLALHLGTQAIGLLFACSWIVAPGALIGLGLGLFRPRSRIELSFVCGALVITLGLLLQASLFGVASIPQERYLFYCVPLLALCLALLVDRGWPLRRLHALLVLPILVIAALIPISTWASAQRLSQSSFLFASYRLEVRFGVGDASLLVAVAISVLALATLALPLSRRLGGVGIFVLAIAFAATALALATDLDNANSAELLRLRAPDKGWVDRLIDANGGSDGQATLLQGHSTRYTTLTQLFWNRSTDKVALLPRSVRPDILDWPRMKVAGDGSLSVAGKPLDGPLVIDELMDTIKLRGAVKAGHSAAFSLWLPRGRPRFAFIASGFGSGLIAPFSALELWPEKADGRIAGFLTFRLRTAHEVGSVKLSLSIPGAAKQHMRLRIGDNRPVRIAVCSNGPWRATMIASPSILRGTLLISARSNKPTWRADTRTCAAARPNASR
jgi:hypothetical protein